MRNMLCTPFKTENYMNIIDRSSIVQLIDAIDAEQNWHSCFKQMPVDFNISRHLIDCCSL